MMRSKKSSIRLVMSVGNLTRARQSYLPWVLIIACLVLSIHRYDAAEYISNMAEDVSQIVVNSKSTITGSVPEVKAPYESCKNSTDRTKEKQLKIAYVFLSSDNLSLWPVWEEYFSTCSSEMIDVIVHSVNPVNMSSMIPIFQLPTERTLNESLRFSYDMVQATLNLYRSALERACGKRDIKNCDPGMLPDFIHLLSDSCAPTRTCADVNTYLQDKQGKSFVERQLRWSSYHEETDSWDNYRKSSQWVTLTGKHALHMVLREDKLHKKWSGFNKHNGKAPDEYLPATELSNWGLETHRKVLTFSWWQGERKGFDESLKKQGLAELNHKVDYSHPATFETSDYVKFLLANTPEYLFVRKVRGGEALHILLSNLQRGRECITAKF
ncbi:hypothetical protein SARC_12984 [Sphaeroforma arctica JP610]|uniref:Uncharacterized protein n=1 Tax=Sphaeroforma arctica JP610 TaxID=667725 RepID=A0A0L0FDA6_9EUKA|nr:hypothetical protein SARC_12984 [Sphaeroforma arctica JP610]KNC74471.1 hypothetical protein SARC_12984 [Sphaeroforma arctica JP610]|eukprot:XP_014148373.1 hypothetical protein SARC_12984 [Sphaeroforma arctica JP610]